MLDKPALLLVVIAILIVAAWLSAAPKTGRDSHADWLQERLNAHRRYVTAHVMDDLGRMRSGYAQTNQDAIRRLYQECGSY